MAKYPLNSPEFAECWRSVSESILAALQGIVVGAPGARDGDLPPTGGHVTPVGGGGNPGPGPVPPPPVAPKEAEILYATRPIPKGDGTYQFKNPSVERQNGHTYKIWRYEDGSFEFEFLTNMSPEERQNFKDNQADRMPDSVGQASGAISASGAIVIESRGKGRKSGKSMVITEPVIVKFN